MSIWFFRVVSNSDVEIRSCWVWITTGDVDYARFRVVPYIDRDRDCVTLRAFLHHAIPLTLLG